MCAHVHCAGKGHLLAMKSNAAAPDDPSSRTTASQSLNDSVALAVESSGVLACSDTSRPGTRTGAAGEAIIPQ
jgi:hypothetical protein